jgi:hypothetical protein
LNESRKIIPGRFSNNKESMYRREIGVETGKMDYFPYVVGRNTRFMKIFGDIGVEGKLI